MNVGMPRYVVQRLSAAMNERSKSIKGSKVLILGLAYKKDVDDVRESPSLELLALLKERGAKVDYNDPHIPIARSTREHNIGGMKSVRLTPANLRKYDAVLISTNHSSYDYQMIVDHSQLVIDTRNACEGIRRGKKKIIKA